MSFFQKLKVRFDQKTAYNDAVFALYNALVKEAREPDLYKNFAIPDTLDGRFDAICFHIALFGLATNETVSGDREFSNIGKDLIGVFLKDMDRNLREIGVGDLSVGKKVKKMASALYGRIDAYRAALLAKDQTKALIGALARNLYRGEAIAPAKAKGLAAYGILKFNAWRGLGLETLKAGRLA